MPALPLIIAHRGASHLAPENSLPAFELAWQEGADGIEADFRLTRDGSIVCIHDPTTGRTAGADMEVENSTLNELRRLDIGSWKGSRWAETRIATLAEVLAALPAGRRLYLEVKSGAEILEPLGTVLKQADINPSLIRILCFDSSVIKEVGRRFPDYRACLILSYKRRLDGVWIPTQEEVLATLRQTGCSGLASAARRILDQQFVDMLHREGLEVHVWTVDSPFDARYFSNLAVDSIITNRPAQIRQELEAC